jgi:hypothetical protein
MTNAINFNWFYHNNCKEFQGIKNRIWEFNNPTEKQLEHWWWEHCNGGYNSFWRVLADIEEIKEEFDTREWEWMDFTEFAFDKMYQDGNCAPWLKG